MLLSNFPVTRVRQSRLSQVDFDNLAFGKVFSDHMFSMVYENGSWQEPAIHPYEPMSLEPGVGMLHYGQTVFDGYKAFRGVDGDARIFRPDMNAQRLFDSCHRLCIPIMEVEQLSELMISATRELIELDHAWMPSQWGHSLYVRPLVQPEKRGPPRHVQWPVRGVCSLYNALLTVLYLRLDCSSQLFNFFQFLLRNIVQTCLPLYRQVRYTL